MDMLTPPEVLHLECGAVVPHLEGTEIFNYYDRKLCVIERLATFPDASTMPVHALDNGAWWVTVRHADGSAAMLDQSRMCSIEFAQSKGWIK